MDGYNASSIERNRRIDDITFEGFKGRLLRLFIEDSIALTKVESGAVRDLLIYYEPRLRSVIPSRSSIKRYMSSAYDYALEKVESELSTATTRINFSFDLWTSPGRRLSLLSVVGHYLNANYEPHAVLLALSRMTGSYSAASLKNTLVKIVNHFNLRTRFSHAITDNASENRACIDLLADELHFNAEQRHVLCIGHIINLIAHQVLFSEDVKAFEVELASQPSITAEEVERQSW